MKILNFSEIIDTLRNIVLCKANELGYIPTFTRTDLSDHLHEKFGFKMDNEFATTEIIEKILKNLKK